MMNAKFLTLLIQESSSPKSSLAFGSIIAELRSGDDGCRDNVDAFGGMLTNGKIVQRGSTGCRYLTD